jgi:hypothetical protein
MFDFGNIQTYRVHACMHKGTAEAVDHYEFLWAVFEHFLEAHSWLSPGYRTRARGSMSPCPSGGNKFINKSINLAEEEGKVMAVVHGTRAGETMVAADSAAVAVKADDPRTHVRPSKVTPNEGHQLLRPSKMKGKQAKRAFLPRACVVCKIAGKRKDTVWGCSDCDPPVHLHQGHCFKIYHDMLAEDNLPRVRTRKSHLYKRKASK